MPENKMRPEVKEKWLNALRSGEYQQGSDALKITSSEADDAPAEYCCLGVLCDLAVKAGVIDEPVYDVTRDWVYGDDKETSWTSLPETVSRWAGLVSEDGYDISDPYVRVPHPRGGEVSRSLSSINDSGKTFEDIAQIIEEQL
jgi:hypothetical protein